jgi:branched-chain amino acid aminotransferase
MQRLVLIDGKVFAPEEAKVGVYDRGFLYGDSVFETIRTYRAQAFALEEHVARLESSAAKLGIVLPVPPHEICSETRHGLEQVSNPESYARIMITRGSGPLGLDPANAGTPLRVTLIEPLTRPPAAHYEHGIAVQCIQTVRASDAVHSAKLANYLASALALRQAREAGAEEALVVNREGLVVEGTTSNVFAVRGGVLITPAVEVGLLPGVTRRILLDIAAELVANVQYRALSPAELAASDEVFISSTLREVLPVVRVDGRTVAGGLPGELTRRLHRAFRSRAGVGEALPFEEGATP